jgi:hypothetical protein
LRSVCLKQEYTEIVASTDIHCWISRDGQKFLYKLFHIKNKEEDRVASRVSMSIP